jgi:hypothetical protein|tara:strand:+ start:365 stop:649 length:285 start_codon:yes stop_codon:yes gene_type:complete
VSEGFLELGNVMVSTTENRGHPPEFWAEQVTNKICDISSESAPHIRQQALAFRNVIYSIVLNGMISAIESNKVTLVGQLNSQGHEEMARIIKEL